MSIQSNSTDNNFSILETQRDLYAKLFYDLKYDLDKIVINKGSKINKGDLNKLINLFKDIKMNISSLEKTVNEPFMAAILGAQGTGKSTLINLLLEEKLMPQTIHENEVTIIKTQYCDDEKLNLQARIYYFKDEKGEQKTEVLTYKEFLDLIDLNKSGRKILEDENYKDKIEYIELLSNNENLKYVQLINTPGLRVLTADFYQKVRHLFKESDIIIWVFGANNILDAFNKTMIEEIYKDNKNIIGVLAKADILFAQDPEKGVKDVVEQFLYEIEKNLFYRVEVNGNDEICLFPYDGKAASIALGFEENILIYDYDNIDSYEEKELRMLWNVYNYGYPFIFENKDFRKDFNLYIPQNENNTESKSLKDESFNPQKFLEKLIEEGFLEKIKEKTNYKIIYTEKGKELLYIRSQLSTISDFANNYIFSKNLNDKLNSLKNRFLSFYEDGNKLSELQSIKNKFENELEKINSDFNESRKNLEENIKYLSKKYNEWSENRIYKIITQKGYDVIELVISRMDQEINKMDMAKEIWAMVKSKFGGEREGPAIKKIKNICSESIEEIVNDSIDEIINDAQQEINNILSILDIDYQSEDITKFIKINIEKNFDIKRPKPHFKNDIKKLLPLLEPLIRKLAIEIAQTDLRKRLPQIAILMVKMIRAILKKLGIKFLKNQSAKATAKILMGPVVWVSFALDIILSYKVISDMLADMKNQIKDELSDSKSRFSESLRDIFSNVYSTLLNETVVKIRDELKIDDEKVMEYQGLINNIQAIISIFGKYKTALN